MANDLLNELNRNLKSAEEVGDKEWAKRLKARISKLEKAVEPEEAPALKEAPSAEEKRKWAEGVTAKPSNLSKKSKES